MKRLLMMLRSYWVFIWVERFGFRRPLPPDRLTADAIDERLRQHAESVTEHWKEVQAKIYMYQQEAKIASLRAQRMANKRENT